ncbi:BlaI/MecI/CopY family transcriptional regulator [Planctomycetota bacterium]|nr:BlaI/MecI/CopY family transcriptional regulator [Planctomycetota bacterium]MDC3251997.1 BlaI/MecI/CopY family transcriptional regulator [Planctomycetota bacterium]
MSHKNLPNAELALMELLWNDPALTARQIREQLYPGDSRSQNGTVQRLLQRLEEKKFIKRDRELPVHLFSPISTRESYVAQQMTLLTEKLTQGSFVPAITHLLDEKKLSRSEIDKLRAILEKESS